MASQFLLGVAALNLFPCLFEVFGVRAARLLLLKEAYVETIELFLVYTTIDHICGVEITKGYKVVFQALLEYFCLRSHVIHYLEAADIAVLCFGYACVVTRVIHEVYLKVLLAELVGIVVIHADIDSTI